jgi:hypothetical protein
VVAFLTTAGTKWNGWSGSGGSVGGKEPLGGTSSFSFPMIIVDLQKFLTRGGDTGERFVGEPLRFELEANQFQGRARRFVQVEEGPLDPGREPDPEAPLGFKSEPEKTQAAANEGKFGFTFDNRAATGVHMVRVYPQKKDAPPEERWFAYNIDTRAESNLRRAQSEEMTYTPTQDKEKKGSVVMFNVAASHDLLRERQSDTSESPWLYVIILLVLIAEQALAVHLSFHLKGGDTPAVGRPAGQPAAA